MSDYGTDELLDRLDEGRGHCGMCGEQAVERNSRGQYICMACLHESSARYDLVLRWDAADEITRLRAALADAQAVGFAAGVEAAAKRCDAIAGNTADFNHYHRRAAGQCGAAIRALTPPDLTAAAARVLLGVWPTDDSFRAAFDACAARYHGGDQMQDEMDRTRATVSAALHAIAGDTP